MPEGFHHVAWGDLDAVRANVDGTVAAVLIEPVQVPSSSMRYGMASARKPSIPMSSQNFTTSNTASTTRRLGPQASASRRPAGRGSRDGRCVRSSGVAPALLVLDGRVVGRLTTVARHHEEGPIALAVVKRNTPVDADLVAGTVAGAQTVIVTP